MLDKIQFQKYEMEPHECEIQFNVSYHRLRYPLLLIKCNFMVLFIYDFFNIPNYIQFYNYEMLFMPLLIYYFISFRTIFIFIHFLQIIKAFNVLLLLGNASILQFYCSYNCEFNSIEMAINSPMPVYYALVFLLFLGGCYVSSFGPLIPHLSELSGNDETYYSYLFFLRSIANIFGGFLIKILIKRFELKYIVYFNLIVICLSLISSSLSISTLNLSVTLFIASLHILSTGVIIFSLTFKLFANHHPEYYLQMLGFVFGIGAMSGPFLVMIFSMNTLSIIGILHLLAIPIFVKYKLPILNEQVTEKSLPIKQISSKCESYICLLMFVYATQELGLASWIPTYAIKAGVSDFQHSGIYSTLFWLPNCIFRLIWIYLPGTINNKLRVALSSLLITTALMLVFQELEWYKVVCIFGPITSGILLSNLYSFCLSLPTDNGFDMTTSNSANFMLANCFGQGFLIMPLGYSISCFGFKSLMFQLFIFAIVAYWSLGKILTEIQKESIVDSPGEFLMVRKYKSSPQLYYMNAFKN